MKNLFLSLMVIFLTTQITSCSKSSSGDRDKTTVTVPDYVETPAAGKTEGEAFTILSGYAEVSSFEPDTLRLSLYMVSVEGDICAPFGTPTGVSEVMISVDNKVGETQFSGILGGSKITTVTIYNSHSKVNSLMGGKVEIQEIGDTIKGRASIYQDADNYMNGTFDIKLCAE